MVSSNLFNLEDNLILTSPFDRQPKSNVKDVNVAADQLSKIVNIRTKAIANERNKVRARRIMALNKPRQRIKTSDPGAIIAPEPAAISAPDDESKRNQHAIRRKNDLSSFFYVLYSSELDDNGKKIVKDAIEIVFLDTIIFNFQRNPFRNPEICNPDLLDDNISETEQEREKRLIEYRNSPEFQEKIKSRNRKIIIEMISRIVQAEKNEYRWGDTKRQRLVDATLRKMEEEMLVNLEYAKKEILMVALDFMVVGLLARIGKAGVKAMSSGEKLARSAAVKASTDAVYEGHKYVGGYTGKEKNVWAEIFGSEVDFLIGCIPTIGTSQSVTNVYFSLEHVFKLKEEYQKKVDEELLLRQKEWRIPGLIIDDLRDLLDNPTYPTEVDDLVQTLRELTPYKNPNEC